MKRSTILQQPLRAYPHYASDHQLASRGRINGADASVQQHRALHTDTAHQVRQWLEDHSRGGSLPRLVLFVPVKSSVIRLFRYLGL